MTLNGYYAFCFKIRAFSGPTRKIWMKIDQYAVSEEDVAQWMTLVSGTITFMRIFIRGVSLDRERQTTLGNWRITYCAVLRALCTGFWCRVEFTVINILQGCARDLSGRDRDETRDAKVRDRDETETLGILSETRPRPRPRRWGSETRPRPRRSSSRDLGRDVWWKKLSTTKSTELVNTLYLWCCESLLLVHYVHCTVLLQYVRQSVVRL